MKLSKPEQEHENISSNRIILCVFEQILFHLLQTGEKIPFTPYSLIRNMIILFLFPPRARHVQVATLVGWSVTGLFYLHRCPCQMFLSSIHVRLCVTICGRLCPCLPVCLSFHLSHCLPASLIVFVLFCLSVCFSLSI